MVYDRLDDLNTKYSWDSSEYSYLIEKVERIEKLFGSDVLDDFSFAYDADEGDINEYLFGVIDWYIELFFGEALDLSKSYDNNGELYECIEDDYHSVDLYVDGLSTELYISSGLDIYDYDVVDDYLVELQDKC